MGYYLNKTSIPGKKSLASFLILAVLFLAISPLILSKTVSAAPLTEALIRLDRMGINEVYNTNSAYRVLVVAKPATTATEGLVALTFQDNSNSGFTLNSNQLKWTTSTSTLPDIAGETPSAWTTIGAAATSVTDNGNTTTVVFSSGDLTPGTLYAFWIQGHADTSTFLTNPSSTGEKTITIETQTAGTTPIDTSDVAVDIVGLNADQVTVTASVPATFNFDIADTSLALGTLSVSTIETDAMSAPIDIDTNANNGYTAWIRSASPAATLASASTGDAISSTNTGSPVTCSAGSECYVVDANPTTGSPTTEYNGNGTTIGGVISTAYEEFANHTGPVANEQITLTVIVAISGTNEAASDYTDTWEVVGAGNF